MATGIFVGLEREHLESMRDTALSVLTSGGGQVTNYSFGGNSVTKKITMDAKEMLNEALYALRILDGTSVNVMYPIFRRD